MFITTSYKDRILIRIAYVKCRNMFIRVSYDMVRMFIRTSHDKGRIFIATSYDNVRMLIIISCDKDKAP